MIETEGPFVFHERSFCENKDPFGPLEFSVKIPSVKKRGPLDHLIFQEGPSCEIIGQFDHLQFPQKSPPKKNEGPLGEPPFSRKVLLCENGDPLDDLCFP